MLLEGIQWMTALTAGALPVPPPAADAVTVSVPIWVPIVGVLHPAATIGSNGGCRGIRALDLEMDLLAGDGLSGRILCGHLEHGFSVLGNESAGAAGAVRKVHGSSAVYRA